MTKELLRSEAVIRLGCPLAAPPNAPRRSRRGRDHRSALPSRRDPAVAACRRRGRIAPGDDKRPLSTAIEFGHGKIARLLLDRGANPSWPELSAENGASLHAAARAGDRELVELLLARGTDPNAEVDSGGNAVFAAKTTELRDLLMA